MGRISSCITSRQHLSMLDCLRFASMTCGTHCGHIDAAQGCPSEGRPSLRRGISPINGSKIVHCSSVKAILTASSTEAAYHLFMR
jgi:hypothetical protein